MSRFDHLFSVMTGTLLLTILCTPLLAQGQAVRQSSYCPTAILLYAQILGEELTPEKIESGLHEVAQKCRAGDIIAIPMTLSAGIGKLCDFSKQITTTGKLTLCVYVGEIRRTIQ